MKELSLEDADNIEEAEDMLVEKIRDMARDMNQMEHREVTVKRDENDNLIICWPGGPERWAFRVVDEQPVTGEQHKISNMKTDSFELQPKREDEIVLVEI